MVATYLGTGIGGRIIKPVQIRPIHVPRKPGGIGSCTITERRHSAAERSGNATFPLYWLVFEADIALQHDAIHVFWLLQPPGLEAIVTRAC